MSTKHNCSRTYYSSGMQQCHQSQNGSHCVVTSSDAVKEMAVCKLMLGRYIWRMEKILPDFREAFKSRRGCRRAVLVT